MQEKNESNISTIRQRFPLVIFLAIGVCFCGLTGKTPNWGWMGVLSVDFFDNFLHNFVNLRIPVFRPYLFIEYINYKLAGDFWIAENLFYGITCGCIFYLIYKSILLISDISIPILIFIFLFPAYICAADGGVVYDVVFSFSICYLIYWFFISKSINLKIIDIVGLSMIIWLCDTSRPYFIYLLPPILIYLYLKLKIKYTLIIFLTFLLFAFPFHYIQYNLTQGLVLSNYGGYNLREVFPFGPVPPSLGTDPIAWRSTINTTEYTKYSKECSSAIYSQFISNPIKMLGYVFFKKRLKKLFFPSLWWHGMGTINRGMTQAIQPIFNLSLCFLYVYWIFGFFSDILNKEKMIAKSFVLMIIIYLLSFNLFAHNLTEQIRVFLPTLSVFIISSVLFRIKVDKMNKWFTRI